jgi:hypothetical protein
VLLCLKNTAVLRFTYKTSHHETTHHKKMVPSHNDPSLKVPSPNSTKLFSVQSFLKYRHSFDCFLTCRNFLLVSNSGIINPLMQLVLIRTVFLLLQERSELSQLLLYFSSVFSSDRQYLWPSFHENFF